MKRGSSEKHYIWSQDSGGEKEGRIYPESVSPWPKTHSRVVIPPPFKALHRWPQEAFCSLPHFQISREGHDGEGQA